MGWGTLWEIPRTAGTWAGCPVRPPLTLGKQNAAAQRDPGLPTPSLLSRFGREPQKLAGAGLLGRTRDPLGSFWTGGAGFFRAGPHGVLAESP